MMPVIKKNGKTRVCINFRNFNLALLSDEYLMPIADLRIGASVGNKMMTFIDGNMGCNQIYIAKEDVPKMVGVYQWNVMPFRLKNVGTTYQRVMNYMFYDYIGEFIEVDIDNIVIKSHSLEEHLGHLQRSFEQMRCHQLKLNPLKCVFEVPTGNFLGFFVHKKGIEIYENKAKANVEAWLPRSKKELQQFMGKVNFLGKFISNLVGKVKAFS